MRGRVSSARRKAARPASTGVRGAARAFLRRATNHHQHIVSLIFHKLQRSLPLPHPHACPSFPSLIVTPAPHSPSLSFTPPPHPYPIPLTLTPYPRSSPSNYPSFLPISLTPSPHSSLLRLHNG
ncbi:hypothetical protein E2C01_047164 [Portunus trituberculatus]|uniref:Uncharacterized protein n=1 Tax=Portunus trituberculatus TaxID=210409 RepID=A0A5B7G783_PORTR|nr:hypothetical protein [Portunus trituberculatus]